MKIAAVTPTDAASDPKHPDHDRWVKEHTLKLEVEHARRLGRSFRQAEDENRFWLERAEQRARGLKEPAGTPKLRKRKTREERLAERPVVVRPSKIKKDVGLRGLSPCGRCGVCIACKREKRVYLMAIKAKQGDAKFDRIIKQLWLNSMMANCCTGPFTGMTRIDAARKMERELEDICDATVMQMGPWR